ncbi:hypothetical protein MOV61_19080 [Neorhizobium sp. BETTINA12A]|uniref:hypothetical protein n=1 Tax=unclassified Neorhizobium TaxID=2629175 RepID=UPI001FF59015|nr:MULTISPECIES: hypothetical protein [unclassified Neorhizobium]MCJ9674192.1 hypothetical protein [Neorhizobium sp. SHOUNA12B]MCJ9745483.1 hypothetical protein [Neorhizobium sp. SHOUNA12A]MCJ9752827.1 hypothetical protein [Neorhizobium sp. BETTINA12A]
METAQDRTIIPADYPELKQLVWSRDPLRPIPAEEVFSIYERNWRFVDERGLTRREADLIEDLARAFGGGVMLKSR